MDEHRERADQPGLREGSGRQLSSICALLRTLSEARPEVTRHLLAAVRELGLALLAVVEPQGERAQDGPARAGGDGLRRIRLD
ncbi:MAG: hypothetical protein M3N52_04310 [Actinomycetota bacterium]|nr:hypothetical protein [Actinomycetota bacterium]